MSDIAEKVKKYGNEYSVLRQADAEEYMKTLAETAAAASSGKTALPKLIEAVSHSDSAIRYWGATGIGNIGPEEKIERFDRMHSISVGDVIRDDRGRCFVVSPIGFKRLGEEVA